MTRAGAALVRTITSKHNSLNLAAKICSDICPWTLSVPRSEQFSESEARGKLFAKIRQIEAIVYIINVILYHCESSS